MHRLIRAIEAIVGQQQEDISVLAYRTAVFTRMKNQFLPKNERELLKKPEPKKKAQSLEDQLAMAKIITAALGGTVN